MTTTPTHTSSGLRWHEGLALALAVFSFFMAAFISRTVFERLPHLEDELTYVFQARIFARGDVVVDVPTPRRPFWQPFVVEYEPQGTRFGKYSPGWPALLALGIVLGQMGFVNAAAAALNVALVYRLGREVFNPDVGVIAAALTAFSPMALLLNGSLMGHTTALCCFTLFMYAYWRLSRRGCRHPLRWAALAGLALGLLIVNRPLTAVGVTLPFVLWSGLRVLRAALDRWRPAPEPLLVTLQPLLLLAGIALLMSSALPLFNYAATGDPTRNLYTLVWPYDRVGFGECCGRNGHTIIKGIRHARYDLSLTAADLFGWQVGGITPALQEHLRTRSVYWPPLGLSFFILPFGLWLGLRARWLRCWLLLALAWLVIPLAQDADFLRNDEAAIWAWLGVGAIWMLIPPLALAWRGATDDDRTRIAWTWLLLAVAVSLIGLHLAYWVGSQRYSTRYYFEALTALALIGALPIGWLARRLGRAAIYGLLSAALAWSLITYSLPRIEALYRFNGVSPELIAQVEQRRVDDRPLLVIVSGEAGTLSWRAYGSLLAVTGPYLDDDIVVARADAPSGTVREQLVQRFPDRQIIEMQARGDEIWFVDEAGD